LASSGRMNSSASRDWRGRFSTRAMSFSSADRLEPRVTRKISSTRLSVRVKTSAPRMFHCAAQRAAMRGVPVPAAENSLWPRWGARSHFTTGARARPGDRIGLEERPEQADVVADLRRRIGLLPLGHMLEMRVISSRNSAAISCAPFHASLPSRWRAADKRPRRPRNGNDVLRKRAGGPSFSRTNFRRPCPGRPPGVSSTRASDWADL
jgi:hypothetical protein